MALTSIFTAFMQSKAERTQSEIEANQLEFNAKLAEMNEEDARRRGKKEIRQLQQRTARTVGSQRAALAAQGLDPDADTGADVIEATRYFGAEDEETLRANIRKEAFGYKIQAEDLRGRSDTTRRLGKFKSRMTMISGGLRTAESTGRLAAGGG